MAIDLLPDKYQEMNKSCGEKFEFFQQSISHKKKTYENNKSEVCLLRTELLNRSQTVRPNGEYLSAH